MKVQFNIFWIFLIFFSSCTRENNIEIVNDSLKKELNSFIKKVNSNYPCKSDYIIVEIINENIYISNTIPTILDGYLGKCSFENSKIYFYSKTDNYKDYVKIVFPANPNLNIKKGYKNMCHPSMDKVLKCSQLQK